MSQPAAKTNPLKWPSFEQLGRDFFEFASPAITQLSAGSDELDEEAIEGLNRVKAWLEAPCVATVKLDGTNVGVDNAGLIVGRNLVIEAGENYQKVDVSALLAGYAEKAESVRSALEADAEDEKVGQTMLYGELCVNSKYDYMNAGIHRSWLCFGAILRPAAEDEDASKRLASQLRLAGFNACARDESVVVAPNVKFAFLLRAQGVSTVADGYRPAAAGSADDWSSHDGSGSLPCFRSLQGLLGSEWMRRFLVPANGMPIGEGLVLASEADGRLFKLKHGGEDLGKVPDQLAEMVSALRGLDASPRMELLPSGLLGVFETLLLVATTKPPSPAKAAKVVPSKAEDTEALAVYESALTKFDDLESVFEKGTKAKADLTTMLIQQVVSDLEKDYGVSKKDAEQRGKKVVSTCVGIRFGAWKRGSS